MNVLMALLHLYGRLVHSRTFGERALRTPPPALAPAVLVRMPHPTPERLTRQGPG
jgi:hypothetical protein